MLGGSAGKQSLVDAGRTGVAIRGYAPTQGPSTKKSAKKGQVDSGKVDRVVREDPSNAMLRELSVDEDAEGRQEELAQPVGHGASTRRVEGEAFRTDARGRLIPPTYGDVDQGNLGDGWLLAACAAIAKAHPEQLLRRIGRLEGTSDFKVRLGNEEFRVSPEFSNEGYADPMPNNQKDTLWVALVEKAFARREASSYSNLETGNPGRALDALTGEQSRRSSITATIDLAALERRFVEAKKAGRAMVLTTRERGVEHPLQSDHTYAVVDVTVREGACTIKVYNPWGTKKSSRPLESMVHELSMEQIRESCGALYVSGG